MAARDEFAQIEVVITGCTNSAIFVEDPNDEDEDLTIPRSLIENGDSITKDDNGQTKTLGIKTWKAEELGLL